MLFQLIIIKLIFLPVQRNSIQRNSSFRLASRDINGVVVQSTDPGVAWIFIETFICTQSRLKFEVGGVTVNVCVCFVTSAIIRSVKKLRNMWGCDDVIVLEWKKTFSFERLVTYLRLWILESEQNFGCNWSPLPDHHAGIIYFPVDIFSFHFRCV